MSNDFPLGAHTLPSAGSCLCLHPWVCLPDTPSLELEALGMEKEDMGAELLLILTGRQAASCAFLSLS